MYKSLEHHEHAEHIAHAHSHGGEEAHGKTTSRQTQLAALLVAVLAAVLALSEQGAKQAEIKVQANLIAATDAWAQYQAKSTRATISSDVVLLIESLGAASNPDLADRRNAAIAKLKADQERYDKDPKDGREAIVHRAEEYEHARDHALEQTHAYHNGAAALELGIVLATASAIIGSRLLIGIALGLGVIGSFCAMMGMLAPEWGAF